MLRHSCSITQHYSFHLPYHKSDHFFDDNTIMVGRHAIFSMDPFLRLHPPPQRTLSGALGLLFWVEFPQTLVCFPLTGHSDPTLEVILYRVPLPLRIVLSGVRDDIVQLMGGWSSDTFHIYIQLHAVFMPSSTTTPKFFNRNFLDTDHLWTVTSLLVKPILAFTSGAALPLLGWTPP